ncbi:MAG: ATP-binding protein [Patescibacteria group bacterium]|nr:ATP-binding protein [Patescibacteria group bacterium]
MFDQLRRYGFLRLRKTPENEQPKIRLTPSIIVLAGVPVVGKSTVAVGLEQRTNLVRLDADEVRQELYPDSSESPTTEVNTQQMTQAYLTVYERACSALQQGLPVVMAFTFRSNYSRQAVQRIAVEYSVPLHVFHLEAPALEEIERRIAQGGRRFASRVNSVEDFLRLSANFPPLCGEQMHISHIGSDTSLEEKISHILFATQALRLPSEAYLANPVLVNRRRR